ncbi:MAG: glycoside hydrolase family 38 C-terminal domain-containing protein [Acidobacteriota bacterium]
MMQTKARTIGLGLTPLICLLASTLAARAAVAEERPLLTKVDLSKDKVLYVVAYAHLDTQWRWDYATTIDEFIRNTLDDNFGLFAKHPDYIFNFTGAARYNMMKEYYPARFEKMKEYVRQGRWHVSGSSVDEGDVNVPSPESVIRQILYGNIFFRRELGVESTDYMLPDCFGFPASLPSIFAHCGLTGFSTQKLSWGSAAGVPFSIGVWEGPDGRGVVCAMNPGDYAAGISSRLDTDRSWVRRVDENGERYGVFADYHYYGVGDEGGAPEEKDVEMLEASLRNPDAQVRVLPAASDQLYKDLAPEQVQRLPRYKGDLLLTEHSAGSISSQAYMKRWNRKNEQLADAAERAAVLADWLGAQPYPVEKLQRAWARVLGSQFHDILPGTSLPRCYNFAWNDEVLALNHFAAVLQASAGVTSRAMDTRAEGQPLVVYNPLSIEREDVVEAVVTFAGGAPQAVRVYDPQGREIPSQIQSKAGDMVTVLFLAHVPPTGFAVYDVRPSNRASALRTGLSASGRILENAAYRVTVNEAGDISSVVDRQNRNRELLARPAQLQFLHEQPKRWPAWNMDWTDRQKSPAGVVGAPAQIRLVENGPVRVALEVVRSGRGSIFTQHIRLAAGDAGRRLEIKTSIDWQSQSCSLKAAFPLTVRNPQATYNWGLGTIARGNNDPKKYEVPSHEWFDLTDIRGDYGVTVLEDCKFGSDKPDDQTVRLTLLYTPGVREYYQDQGTQDWGRHDVLYALYGHSGDWRTGNSEWQGRRLNQPLVAFQVPPHAGPLGRKFSLMQVSTPEVDVRAFKKAEAGGAFVVRLQELYGRAARNVGVSFAAPVVSAEEVDGQERRIGSASVRDGKLILDMTAFSLRSFAVVLASPLASLAAPAFQPVSIPLDTDVVSADSNRNDGDFACGMTIPAEELTATIETEAATFALGSTTPGASNALVCRGQRIALPSGGFNRIYILAAAAEDADGEFAVGAQKTLVRVPAWTGFIGQFDNRVWAESFPRIDYRGANTLVGLAPGYIKRTPVAWFATHRHHPERGNEAYRFSYLFQIELPLPDGSTELVLPQDERIKIFAVTVARSERDRVVPAQPLYDDFSNRGPITLRSAGAH